MTREAKIYASENVKKYIKNNKELQLKIMFSKEEVIELILDEVEDDLWDFVEHMDGWMERESDLRSFIQRINEFYNKTKKRPNRLFFIYFRK